MQLPNHELVNQIGQQFIIASDREEVRNLHQKKTVEKSCRTAGDMGLGRTRIRKPMHTCSYRVNLDIQVSISQHQNSKLTSFPPWLLVGSRDAFQQLFRRA